MAQATAAKKVAWVIPLTVNSQLVSNDEVAAVIQCHLASDGSVALQQQKAEVESFLEQELLTPVIDEMSGWLWLFARKSPDHIDALHKQRIKRRSILPAEDPKLHLVWHGDVIFVKPLPLFLLNYEFWQTHLQRVETQRMNEPRVVDTAQLNETGRAALGFVRSYSHLIKHESDFYVAMEAHLLPAGVEYAKFRNFIKGFEQAPTEAVSQRYHFGQIRLTRLNWAVRLCRPSSVGATTWSYHTRHWQSGQFFSDVGPSLLAIFAVLSLALSAMQVVFAAVGSDTYPGFAKASWGFSLAVLVMTACTVAATVLGLLCLLIAQGQYACRKRLREVFSASKTNL